MFLCWKRISVDEKPEAKSENLIKIKILKQRKIKSGAWRCKSNFEKGAIALITRSD